MEKKHFVLNFNNEKKVISVELKEAEGIFQLAKAFSTWLTANGIENILTEMSIDEIEILEDETNNNKH